MSHLGQATKPHAAMTGKADRRHTQGLFDEWNGQPRGKSGEQGKIARYGTIDWLFRQYKTEKACGASCAGYARSYGVRFCLQLDVANSRGAVSIPPGSRRNETSKNRLARFWEFFNFRLLQQYLPTRDMLMSTPKEEKPPDGTFSIQPDDLGSRGHQCRDCTRTDCTHAYPSCERQVLSGAQSGQCRLSQGMEMHVEPASAAEAEASWRLAASLTSH